jgi:hypothetical protein
MNIRDECVILNTCFKVCAKVQVTWVNQISAPKVWIELKPMEGEKSKVYT